MEWERGGATSKRKGHGQCQKQMEGVLGGAISRWNGDVALLRANEKRMRGAISKRKGLHTQMGIGWRNKQTRRVMDGFIRKRKGPWAVYKWNGDWAMLQASAISKQIKGVWGGAISK